MRSIVDCVMIFKGRGLKMGVFVGGGGGGVDLDLDFKNFWDGVYNFFFCPPLAYDYKNKNKNMRSSQRVINMRSYTEIVSCYIHSKYACCTLVIISMHGVIHSCYP